MTLKYIKSTISCVCITIIFTACSNGNNNNKENTKSILKIQVQDGYVKDAEVFVDLNKNNVKDEGEPTCTTNITGDCNLEIEDKYLSSKLEIIAQNGIDTDSNTTIEMLKTTMDRKIDTALNLTPVSTLVSVLGNEQKVIDIFAIAKEDLYTDFIKNIDTKPAAYKTSFKIQKMMEALKAKNQDLTTVFVPTTTKDNLLTVINDDSIKKILEKIDSVNADDLKDEELRKALAIAIREDIKNVDDESKIKYEKLTKEELKKTAIEIERKKQKEGLEKDLLLFKNNKITKDELEVKLGKSLFFDKHLSNNRTMSCATCHDSKIAFIDSRENITQKMASLGDDKISIGNRNTPSVAYISFDTISLNKDGLDNYFGGLFWDGRAENARDQAKHPFLNPIEMNIKDLETLISRLEENSSYKEVLDILYPTKKTNEEIFDSLALAISIYEQTDEFSPFNSKYDRYLKDEYTLSALEEKGREIFFETGSCSSCHSSNDGEEKDFFTLNFYRNLELPANKKLQELRNNEEPDLGLYKTVKEEAQKGKFRTPTLRNIVLTAPYMHNGVFKNLRTVLEFYDKHNNPKRVNNPETKKPWGKGEVIVQGNIDPVLLSAQEQSDEDIDALMAFLKLLTDKKYEPLIK